MKSIEERKLILDNDILKHLNHGWRVATRSEAKCLLVRDKKVNIFLLVFLLLLFLVPGIIYLYMNKGRSTLKIEVTKEGNIKYTATGLSSFQKNELHWY